MNFMGVGMLELGVIFLVTFLVLGPNKSIEMARTAGRVIRSLRRTLSDMAAAVDLDKDEGSTQGGTVPPPPDPGEAPTPRDQT